MYHSLITQPAEVDEAARMFRLTKWERFWHLDVPSSIIGLVWNGMMSFGGGWFFLAAFEAISVAGRHYALNSAHTLFTCTFRQCEGVHVSHLTRRRRSTVRPGVVVAAAGLLLVAGVSGRWVSGQAPRRGPECTASAGSGTFSLDREQARNATTIAAVAKRMGLPNHAVTVGLAAGLQESKLRNLTYGDRDSVGLFQQRPSQGWGTRRQILVPSYAARAFFSRLVQLPGWESLPVTEAAQGVQRSGAPEAYAQWDQPSRILAQALTGEVAAGFTCRLPVASGALRQGPLTNAERVELGVAGSGVRVTPTQGWTVSGWLIGHAGDYGITTVDYAGQRWSARTGVWGSASHAFHDPSVVAVNAA